MLLLKYFDNWLVLVNNFILKLLTVLTMILTSSCATRSYEDVKSKKFGVLLMQSFYSGDDVQRMSLRTYKDNDIIPVYITNFQIDNHRDSMDKKFGLEKGEYLLDYYYSLIYVEPGKYSISELGSTISINSKIMQVDFEKNELCFDIKAGEINYIGSIYLQKKDRIDASWFSEWFINGEKFQSKFVIFNGNNAARKFMKTYYPDYRLPFTTSIISKARCKAS